MRYFVCKIRFLSTVATPSRLIKSAFQSFNFCPWFVFRFRRKLAMLSITFPSLSHHFFTIFSPSYFVFCTNKQYVTECVRRSLSLVLFFSSRPISALHSPFGESLLVATKRHNYDYGGGLCLHFQLSFVAH